MRQTKKRDCNEFKPGDLVKGAPMVDADIRIGKVLPIDAKQARNAFDSETKIGKFCATSSAYQYIYVDFTKKLNPHAPPYAIGKKWENVRDIQRIPSTKNTKNTKARKTQKARK